MLKKILSVFIAVILMLSIAGCGNDVKSGIKTAPEEYYSCYFDRFGDEVMPIGGYVGPVPGFGYDGNYMPNQITDYQYKTVKECGLNFIIDKHADYKNKPEEALLMLEHADNNDVMVFVTDSYLFEVTDNTYNNPDLYTYTSLKDFKDRVKAYSSYGSFAGLYGRDEPFANMFDQLKQINNYFNQTFGDDKMLYMNSNSFQCPVGWFGGGPNGTAEEREMTIEEYMTAWFESFPTLGYYSYDTYPFITTNEGYIRTDIFENYVLVKEFSEKYNVPFWTFMQSAEELGANMREPNRGEILWQVSTALAFGAKGYTWYTYGVPPELTSIPEGKAGLIGRAGQKTERWYYAQEANQQTAAVDHILMKSVHKGTIQTLSGKYDTTNAVKMPQAELDKLNGKFREVTSITGDNAITGCFTYMGKTVLYVVNNSETLDKAKVRVNFDGNYEFEVIQGAKSNVLVGDNVELTFAPGQGALIAIH